MTSSVNDKSVTWTCICGITHSVSQPRCWNCKRNRVRGHQPPSQEDAASSYSKASSDAVSTPKRDKILQYAEAMRRSRQRVETGSSARRTSREKKQFLQWLEGHRAHADYGAVIGFTVARVIAAVMLVLALDRNPYSYYILLRWVVCGVSMYGVYMALKLDKLSWFWCFGSIGLLFNPLIPFYLSRSVWTFVDVAVAILFLVSIPMLRRS